MEPRIRYAKTSDGVSIAYAVFGEGPPIVHLGSFPGGAHHYSHSATSRRRIDRLVDLGWRVVRYDGRGTGSSDRDAVDFSLEARLRDLEAVVDRLGWNAPPSSRTDGVHSRLSPTRRSGPSASRAWCSSRHTPQGRCSLQLLQDVR